VVTYKVIGDVENNDLLLRPGMTANVTIVVAKVEDVLKVPNGALRFKPPGEAEDKKSGKPSIRERAIFKNTVSRIGLDGSQSEAFVNIIEEAGIKLKAVYALPEVDRDLKQAWQSFYTQVFTNLYKILREDQHEKFRVYVAELREAKRKRELYKGRFAKVYVPGDDGQPKLINITAGITDDDETQVIQGDLKEGGKVIVGLHFSAGRKSKPTGNIFSSLFRRKR
jgi:HlyD family secretion protein